MRRLQETIMKSQLVDAAHVLTLVTAKREGMTTSDDELEARLRLPEKTVAKKLGLGLTSLKKTCRSQHGFSHWPYR